MIPTEGGYLSVDFWPSLFHQYLYSILKPACAFSIDTLCGYFEISCRQVQVMSWFDLNFILTRLTRSIVQWILRRRNQSWGEAECCTPTFCTYKLGIEKNSLISSKNSVWDSLSSSLPQPSLPPSPWCMNVVKHSIEYAHTLIVSAETTQN